MRESDISWLKSRMNILYLVRDPKDALLSGAIAYRFGGRESEVQQDRLEDWILNCIHEDYGWLTPIESWRNHVSGWRKHEDDLTVVKYEDYIQDYEWQSRRLSRILGTSVEDTIPPLQSCTASRKGIVGDHINHLSGRMIEFINHECREEIKWIESLREKKKC